MSYRYFIGVDPGKTGGVAVVTDRGALRECRVMPIRKDGTVSGERVAALVWDILADNVLSITDLTLPKTCCLAMLEKVWAMPGQGVCSMFTFGKLTGQVDGALAAVLGDQQVYEIAPQSWQRSLWGPSSDSKKSACDYVRERWPEESFLATSRSRKPHQGMVDAACLADYARLHWRTFAEGIAA